MGDFIKKHEIWIFLVLCPIVGTLFVQARIEGFMSESIYMTGRFCILLFMLICLLLYTRGIKGVINLFYPMLNWKLHLKWYLLSALILPTVAVTTLVLKSIYNDVEYDAFIYFKTTTFRAYMAFLVWSFIGEVVWVSYCIRELSKITKPFYSGLIVAVFWGTWFVPVIILGEGIFPEIPIIPAYIFRFGAAGLCAFIYSRTKSAIPVLILQFAANLTLVSFPITPTNGGATTYTTFGVIYFLAMLGLWGLDYVIKKNKNKATVQSQLNS